MTEHHLLADHGIGTHRPDRRGRTGLDRAYEDVDGNPDVVLSGVEVVSDGWGVLRLVTLNQRRRDGSWQTRERETYDRGDSAVILPYDAARGTVLLTRQFRLPPYVNGHRDGMLVEAAAGMLDPGEDAATTIRREAEEELGVRLGDPTPLFTLYPSPGAATERQFFFSAPYTGEDRTSDGGGLAEEGEDIEVLELSFDEAMAMVGDGRIVDAKTVILLQQAALDGRLRTG